MTGNESILILRGTRNKIKGNTLNLLPGQLLYNNTNNYLTIGKGLEGENNSISESNGLRLVKGSPITVPTLEGTFNNVTGDCTIEIGATDAYTGEYYLKPYKNSLLQLYSQNDLNINAGRSLTIFSDCTGTTSEDRLKLVSNHKILNEAPKIELHSTTYTKLDTPELNVSDVTLIKSNNTINILAAGNILIASGNGSLHNTINLDNALFDLSSNNTDINIATTGSNKNINLTSASQCNINGPQCNINSTQTTITKLKISSVPSEKTDAVRKKELDEAIDNLDSSISAPAHSCLTGITITDGKITSKTESNEILSTYTPITFTPAETALSPENVRALIGENSLIRRGSWYYAGNGYIAKGSTARSACPFGAIDLAGTTVIQANTGSDAYTQLYITPPTASTSEVITGELLYYIDNGESYSPTWYRVLTNANCNSILDDRYVNTNGDTMTGSLTFDNSNTTAPFISDIGIKYKGTQSTYDVIKFIDNPTDTFGNGILIGGGGSTVIGSGESATSFWTKYVEENSSSNGGIESLILTGDENVYIYTNCLNVSSSGTAAAKKFTFKTDGTFEAAIFNTNSDKRLKENIKPYLNKEKSILDLPVYKFDFKLGKKDQIGCLAQDLQEICPEIVDMRDDGYLSIQESKLVYLLLEELRKLKQLFEEYKCLNIKE